MKSICTSGICCVLIFQCVACWAVYGVRISDLSNSPTPPNPIRVWGKVTSLSPIMISDGRAEIEASGLSASIGEFVVVTGDWDGAVLAVDNPFSPEMIHIPAGSFMMGNNGSEPYFYTNELPQHSVNLSGYYIGRYEVTRGEYKQFMDADGYSTQSYWSADGWVWKTNNSRTEPGWWAANQDWASDWGQSPQPFTQTDNHPAVGVSYYEAEAFCNWAGGHLPTEAQWEKAARWTGTLANVYPWDDPWNQEKCNNFSDGNLAGGGYEGYQTAPVGSYPLGVSPYGCQDMAGNVWEWCKDWYASDYYSQSPADDPQGPASGDLRIVRGGGWGYYDNFCRSACRSSARFPSDFSDYNGFRLAR